MKLYSTSTFKLFQKDGDDWCYCCTDKSLTLATIETLLNLNNGDKYQIIEKLEKTDGIYLKFKDTGEEYFIVYDCEQDGHKLPYFNSFEDVSVSDIEMAIENKQKENEKKRKII